MGIEINKCLIISGSPTINSAYLKKLDLTEYYVICADYGRIHADKFNIIPNLYLGDYDSSTPPCTNVETIVLPCEKDESDTFYAVKLAIKKGFNDITLLSAIGNRIDHSYANILCLNYIDDNKAVGKIITDNCKISLLKSGKNIINKDNYSYFSIFPFFKDVNNLNIINAKYPLQNYYLNMTSQLGLSNEIIGDSCEITFNSGKLVLIQSND